MNMLATKENLPNLETKVGRGDVVDIETRDRISVIENMRNDVIEKELRRPQPIIVENEHMKTLFNRIGNRRENDCHGDQQEHACHLFSTAHASSRISMSRRFAGLFQLSIGENAEGREKDNRKDSVEKNLKRISIVLQIESGQNGTLTRGRDAVEHSDRHAV
jgi:hypothetical protein